MRCPERNPDGDRRYGVTLSQFVSVTRLAGAQHPAVYCVHHQCAACGGSHDALLTHDELDCAPVVGCAFLIELAFLGGRERLAPFPVEALISYASEG